MAVTGSFDFVTQDTTAWVAFSIISSISSSESEKDLISRRNFHGFLISDLLISMLVVLRSFALVVPYSYQMQDVYANSRVKLYV